MFWNLEVLQELCKRYYKMSNTFTFASFKLHVGGFSFLVLFCNIPPKPDIFAVCNT